MEAIGREPRSRPDHRVVPALLPMRFLRSQVDAELATKSLKRLAPAVGFEPTTNGLTVRCATAAPRRISRLRRPCLAEHGSRRQPFRRWRPGPESNRRTRICSPLHDHSATGPPAPPSIKSRAAPGQCPAAFSGPGPPLPTVVYRKSTSGGSGAPECRNDRGGSIGALHAGVDHDQVVAVGVREPRCEPRSKRGRRERAHEHGRQLAPHAMHGGPMQMRVSAPAPQPFANAGAPPTRSTAKRMRRVFIK